MDDNGKPYWQLIETGYISTCMHAIMHALEGVGDGGGEARVGGGCGRRAAAVCRWHTSFHVPCLQAYHVCAPEEQSLEGGRYRRRRCVSEVVVAAFVALRACLERLVVVHGDCVCRCSTLARCGLWPSQILLPSG